MISYTGEECIVCKKKFTDDDDIVSCPVCGTPYHRDCYREKGECVNYALHESGRSWVSEAKERKKTMDGVKKVCPECSFINAEDASQCVHCGADLENRECRTIDLSDENIVRIELDADADYFGFNPMEIMDESTGITIGEMGDYARFNKFYYMFTFRRLKKAAVKFSLNLLAFMFPQFYCASRKMYVEALVIMIIRTLLSVPALIDYFSDMAVTPDTAVFSAVISYASAHAVSAGVLNLFKALNLAVQVLFSLFANELYFRHTVSELKRMRKSVPDYLKYREVIKTCGGLSAVGVICIVLVQIFLVSVILFVFSLLGL